jgi:hypothetical protein
MGLPSTGSGNPCRFLAAREHVPSEHSHGMDCRVKPCNDETEKAANGGKQKKPTFPPAFFV